MQNITDIEQITPDIIRKFLVHLSEHHNQGGVLAYLKTLRAWLNWYELETGQPSPMKRIKTPDNHAPLLDPANPEDIKRMIAKSGSRDKAILLTLLDTGIRASELIDLDVEDVNLITGMVYIRHGKGDKPRTVYIGRRTRQALRAYAKHQGVLFQTDKGERMTYSGLRQIVRRRALDANVPAPPLHSFRRLFAITMLRAGVDIYSLQILMGHSDIQVLKRYLKLTQADTLQAHLKGSPVDKWRF